MSCTSSDDALSWLLSISATCASSPIRFSSPADHNSSSDFTDWLQMSPTSTPLHDVTSSARVNHLQAPLNYRYDFSDVYKISPAPLSREDTHHMALPSSILPGAFNAHNRMDSETSSLLNTPSPRSFSFYSSFGTPNLPQVADPSRHHPESPNHLSSPLTGLFQDFQKSTFESYYDHISVTSRLADQVMSDVSPVVRADDLKNCPAAAKPKPQTRQKKPPQKNSRRSRPPKSSSFARKLHAAPFSLPVVPTSPNLPSVVPGAPNLSLLLSPVKLVTSSTARAISNDTLQSLPGFSLPEEPTYSPNPLDLPGLSPLTPLESSPQAPKSSPLKITIKLKRQQIDPSTPQRRSKRQRTAPVSSPPIEENISSQPRKKKVPKSDTQDALRPLYSNRTLPSEIPVSEKFPLFYRRFPVSSWFQTSVSDSPCSLFGVAHPGGNYNPPRDILDLYTPRFVKGKGVEKVGLCPICVEPLKRGGENKKLWLAMKFSAFKCYHMQYAHGISASTGKPFSPPIGFRVVPRPNPGKKEKSEIQQGQCHKCSKWIAIEGVKDMENKVPELYWWKHAAACHQNSSLQGESDCFEHDDIYATILALAEPSARV